MNNNFDIKLFRSLLNADSFIKHIEFSESTVSTQADAKNFVQQNGVTNALFIADRQTAGYGRFKRTWLNTENALLFSLLFRPKISISQIPLISFAAGFAMKTLLKIYGLNTELKWPNDILFHGKKLCGILSEASTVSDSLFFVITGIGLNVNSDSGSLAREIADTATSLKSLTDKEFSREKLLAEFLPLFEHSIHLIETSPKYFLQKYKDNCDTLGKEVKIISDGDEILGVAEDINANGAILINKNGERKAFFAADVIHLRTV